MKFARRLRMLIALENYPNISRYFLLFAVFLTVNFSTQYWSVQNIGWYNRESGNWEADAEKYVKIYQGENIENILPPFKHRILTPLLARLVPIPEKLIEKEYNVTNKIYSEAKFISLRFFLVNVLALTVFNLLFFKYLLLLNFNPIEAIIGNLIFCTSWAVVSYLGLPMVDAVFFVFFMLTINSVIEERIGIYFFAVLIGAFSKETIVFAMGTILALKDRRIFLKFATAGILAAIPYLVFRFIMYPGQVDFTNYIDGRIYLLTNKPLWTIINFAKTFGVFWIIGIWGFIKYYKYDSFLFKITLLFLPLMLLTVFSGADYGRILVIGYYFIIPYSLLIIMDFFKTKLITDT